MERPLTLILQHCPAPARRDLWVRSGLDPIRDDLPAIVDSFLITPGNLVAAADVALTARSRPAGRRSAPTTCGLAVGQLNRQQLEPLATRLEPHTSPRPVLDPGADEELATLLLRCRFRERLAAEGVTADRGVRALFSGPSGTGKTLAARYLAGCLSLDIYRVNLATVVNKYIGVTERNLDKVLTIAEELGVVLLLDEGDSLMAKRTDVYDANDRYANLETNFLLQRLEGFSGIVLITSNRRGPDRPGIPAADRHHRGLPAAQSRAALADPRRAPAGSACRQRRDDDRDRPALRAHRRGDPQRGAARQPAGDGRRGTAGRPAPARRRTPRVPADRRILSAAGRITRPHNALSLRISAQRRESRSDSALTRSISPHEANKCGQGTSTSPFSVSSMSLS